MPPFHYSFILFVGYLFILTMKLSFEINRFDEAHFLHSMALHNTEYFMNWANSMNRASHYE